MQKELIESEKQMIKSHIFLLTKRLNYLLEYCSPQNINIIDKATYTDLITELADNIKIEIENYILLK